MGDNDRGLRLVSDRPKSDRYDDFGAKLLGLGPKIHYSSLGKLGSKS